MPYLHFVRGVSEMGCMCLTIGRIIRRQLLTISLKIYFHAQFANLETLPQFNVAEAE